MRRWGLVVLLLVLALGGLYLLLLRPHASEDRHVAAGPRLQAEAEGPTLLGSGGGARVESASMGSLVVWVTRDGRPAPADVTLMHRRRLPSPAFASDVTWIERRAVPGSDRTLGVGRATAGADGRVTFVPPHPGPYAAIARTEDGARGLAEARVALDGTSPNVVVEVSGGGTLSLSGRVRAHDHTPWRGFVDVLGEPPEDVSSDLLVPHATDEGGRFRVTGLRPGAAWVVLWTPGTARWDSRRVTLPYDAELVLTMPPQPPQVSCRVLDARTDAPIAGALVSHVYPRTGDFTLVRAEAVSDVHGACRLAGWPRSVQAAGYAPLALEETHGTGEAVLRLWALRGVRGRVVERGTGTPAVGALVVGGPPRYDTFGRTAVAVADAEGRFQLEGMPPGPGQVYVLGGGWLSPELQGADARDESGWAVTVGEDDAAELVREAIRSARVEGRVLDASGVPVRGAVVWLGTGPPAPSPLAWDVWSAVDATWPLARTGPDGKYTLELRALEVDTTLSAVAAPHAPVRVAGVRAGSGQLVTRDLVLPAGRRLLVHVKEAASGAPAVGVGVSARCSTSSTEAPWSQGATTDAHGTARFEGVPHARVWVTAWGRGWTRSEAYVQEEAEAALDLEATLLVQRLSTLVTGSVRFEDGSPVRDIHLSVEGWTSASVDTDGRFEVEGTPVPEVTLEFREGDGDAPILTQVVRTGSKNLDVVLPAPTRRAITLRVLDATGTPVGHFTASWVDDRDGSTGTTANSEIRIPAFEGRIWVLIGNARSGAGETIDAAPTAFGPFESDGRTRDVRLLPGRSVSGRVVDADGRPLPGLQVSATSPLPPQPGELVQHSWHAWPSTTLSDRHGRFVVRGLGEGPAVLQATPPPGLGHGTLEVEAGATNVTLVVPRRATVDVRVTEDDGAPVEGAILVFEPSGRREETNAAGVARLRDVDPGLGHWLMVMPPPLRPELRGLERVFWRPGMAPFVLARSVRIAGRVVDQRGAPVPATVHAEDGGPGSSILADAQGRFELDVVRSGRISLWASAEEPTRTSPRVAVEAGATDLRLVVVEGTTLVVRSLGRQGPAAGGWVRLTSARGAPAALYDRTDAGGIVRFEGLRPGDSYDLFAHHDGEDEVRACAFVGDVRGDAGEVTLTLATPLTLGGFVQGPPPGTTIRVFVQDRGVRASAYARSDGGFLLSDLPAGTWTVHAESIGAERRWVGTATAAAGTRITLSLAPE